MPEELPRAPYLTWAVKRQGSGHGAERSSCRSTRSCLLCQQLHTVSLQCSASQTYSSEAAFIIPDKASLCCCDDKHREGRQARLSRASSRSQLLPITAGLILHSSVHSPGAERCLSTGKCEDTSRGEESRAVFKQYNDPGCTAALHTRPTSELFTQTLLGLQIPPGAAGS